MSGFDAASRSLTVTAPKGAAALPTGFAQLDRALEIGGLPRGRITEIFGPPSCGKTALALQIVAYVQHSGGAAAWIDADHSFSPSFAAQLGADVSRMPVAAPDSAEQAGEIARRFLASGALDLVVIDSAAAMLPELETGTMMAPSGLQSRVLGSELRKLAGPAARSGASVLFLNQTRIQPDRAGGKQETSRRAGAEIARGRAHCLGRNRQKGALPHREKQPRRGICNR